MSFRSADRQILLPFGSDRLAVCAKLMAVALNWQIADQHISKMLSFCFELLQPVIRFIICNLLNLPFYSPEVWLNMFSIMTFLIYIKK